MVGLEIVTTVLVWAVLLTAAAALNQLNKYLKHKRTKGDE